MSDTLLEHYVGLSIAKALIDASITTGAVQVQGFRDPAAPSLEEWVTVDMLMWRPHRSRRSIVWVAVMFQVTCSSRLAIHRTDGNTNAPWKLAAKVRKAIQKTDLAVKKWDTTAQAEVARLLIAEATERYGKEDQAEGTMEGAGTHYVVLTFTGQLTCPVA